MKCPSCGYFNLPGLAACSACGVAFHAPENDVARVAEWSEVLPPRAKNRTAAQKAAHGLGPVGRQGAKAARTAQAGADMISRTLLNQTQQARSEAVNAQLAWRHWLSPARLKLMLHWWSVPLLSLVPGLGQIVQRRWAIGSVLCFLNLPAGVALAYVYFSMPRFVLIRMGDELSTLLLWLPAFLLLNGVPLLVWALVWFSVWDAAKHSFPPDVPGPAHSRSLKLGLLCAMLVSMVWMIGLGIFRLIDGGGRLF